MFGRIHRAGELDVLGITLRNLIENAVRYGAPDEPSEIVVHRDRQIRLLNGGAVIPSETLEALKKPFVRGSSVGGGLGLAIVDSVMRQIGGSLTLISPVMGRVSGFWQREWTSRRDLGSSSAATVTAKGGVAARKWKSAGCAEVRRWHVRRWSRLVQAAG
jgi:signal transduction histidine kinase